MKNKTRTNMKHSLQIFVLLSVIAVIILATSAVILSLVFDSIF